MKGKYLTKLSTLITNARMAVAYDTADAKHNMELAFAEWTAYLLSLSATTRARYDKTHEALEQFYKTNEVQGLGKNVWLCNECIGNETCAWKPSTPEKRKLEDLPPLPTLKRAKRDILPGDDDVLAELLSAAPTQCSDE